MHMSAKYDGVVRRRHLLTSVACTGYVVAPAASGSRDAWRHGVSDVVVLALSDESATMSHAAPFSTDCSEHK